MKLVPIGKNLADNVRFVGDPDCQETLTKTINYFDKLGYVPPWIGYYALVDDKVVGTCAFKGAPRSNKVELAYVTFESDRGKGIGTDMCRQLVAISRKTDSLIAVTARTLREKGHSTRILEKNGFVLKEEIVDADGTPVWEWVYTDDQ